MNRNQEILNNNDKKRMPGSGSCIRLLTAFLLLIVMFVMSGCSEIKITHPLGNNILLEVNDTQCSMGTAVLRLLEAREEYSSSENDVLWTRTIGNTTLAEYIKNSVADDMLKYTAAEVMAVNLTVYLTDQEKTEARRQGEALMEKLGTKYNLAAYSISSADAANLFMKRMYYNKVYEKLSENISMEISEADTKAIEVSYVLVPRSDGIEVAERLRNELAAGNDFSGTCLSYGYNPELRKVVTRGSMSEIFEEYAYALSDNEISEIIETQEGYYIIDCLEDYLVVESQANNNKIISDAKRERFYQAYQEFAKANKMRFNTTDWAKYDVSKME